MTTAEGAARAAVVPGTTQSTAPADADWLELARPRLREAVRVGPGLSEGTKTVHVVSDADTRAYFKVGPREAFLIAQLDGRRSLAEIGARYAELFQRRLDASHWQQLLGLLAAKGLIDPTPDDQLARIRAAAEAKRRGRGRSPLLYRLPIPRAHELVPTVTRWTGWVLHPVVLVPMTIVGLVVMVFVAVNGAELYGALLDTPSRWTVTLAGIAVMWVSIACHEFGHAVATHRFGGRPTEIGLMWRFPLFAFYCKTDDVVTFHRRPHRVATAFAGIYVNLLSLPAFWALWHFGPQTGWWHGLAGLLLVVSAVTTAMNLIPVLKLDGYHMLEHGLSMLNLQGESFRFVGALFRRGPVGIAEYPKRSRVIYGWYAVVALAIVGTALTLMVRLWYVTLAQVVGGPWAAAILAAEAVLVVLFLRWAVRWQRRRRQAAEKMPTDKIGAGEIGAGES